MWQWVRRPERQPNPGQSSNQQAPLSETRSEPFGREGSALGTPTPTPLAPLPLGVVSAPSKPVAGGGAGATGEAQQKAGRSGVSSMSRATSLLRQGDGSKVAKVGDLEGWAVEGAFGVWPDEGLCWH